MGVFGLGEIIANLEHELTRTRDDEEGHGADADAGRLASASSRRSCAAPRLGSVLGILPGGGAMLASFSAYALEKKVSQEPGQFRQGRDRRRGRAGIRQQRRRADVVHPDADARAFPSNPVMALMIGAMIIQGIQPGPSVMTEQPALFWGIIVSMWIGNLFLLVLNLPADRAVGEDDLGALPPAVSGDPGVLRHRRVQPEQQLLRRVPDGAVRARWATSSRSSIASRHRCCSASSSDR